MAAIRVKVADYEEGAWNGVEGLAWEKLDFSCSFRVPGAWRKMYATFQTRLLPHDSEIWISVTMGIVLSLTVLAAGLGASKRGF